MKIPAKISCDRLADVLASDQKNLASVLARIAEAMPKGSAQFYMLVAEIQRRDEIREFCKNLLGALDEHPVTVGIPHVTGAELFDAFIAYRDGEDHKGAHPYVYAVGSPRNVKLDGTFDLSAIAGDLMPEPGEVRIMMAMQDSGEIVKMRGKAFSFEEHSTMPYGYDTNKAAITFEVTCRD